MTAPFAEIIRDVRQPKRIDLPNSLTPNDLLLDPELKTPTGEESLGHEVVHADIFARVRRGEMEP